ncbi:ATP-dependent RNA helicase SUPV3L1/SUV3 [Stella humosa]|uniref:ATP-dependent RNA helicase SUPV3L1/SUV3 n=1 Tax=Stella humosa TaxID=94 RepID=A0A3N1LH50_9PROT|nr:helicase-related protein [Stella humosa]ROP90554.1 ATP-dependent RNA helicase SUPV3L1/SUV3 [Stella humosa]BBK29551.1 helicase [Stella humosa]
MLPRAHSRVVAVLGPTNTGKTHLAIERMLGHATGMIGFPLRLLARENYDRIVRLRGAAAVALVTGEEKIIPANPRYFVCTVESMPLDRMVDFLAIDEVQLAADPERGHIFTARLLHARGQSETMLLGSDTMRAIVRRLVPEAEFVERPRFSTLSYVGERKVTRLPPRSAVVAFSVSDVFEIAELVRRQRGGTAVVLGALSPRARNAQVGMYQAGEVDYLVATDAIGMGLNMDVDHVAFARLAKFDGRAPRRLTAAEIGQIAGRAGRHMSDGTFGTTADIGPMEPEIVEAVENHRFDPVNGVFWRNSRLDMRSLDRLVASLDQRPPSGLLVRAREADDERVLAALRRMPDIVQRARTPDGVRRLWEVCQVPDFRKTMSDTHTRLLAQIYRHLSGGSGRLPEAWVAGHLARMDRSDGDIDTLVARIAHVRTWTYITHRGDWIGDAAHWQDRARTIEDKLSDALHDRLTQRFVDRRAAMLVRRLATDDDLLAAVARDGTVMVEGHPVGRIDGFGFRPDALGEEEARPLLAAARRVLPADIALRVRRAAADPDDAFRLAPDGTIAWEGAPIARLAAGATFLAPAVLVHDSEFLTAPLREALRRRLAARVEAEVAATLAPLFRLERLALDGPGRGLAFQLAEAQGCLHRAGAEPQLAALSPADRAVLTRAGVRFGAEWVYLAPLLRPAAVALRAILWMAAAEEPGAAPIPHPGRLGVPGEAGVSPDFYRAIGYPLLGPRALRVDRLEALSAAARRLARGGPFAATPEIASLADARLADLPGMLVALGYRMIVEGTATTFVPVSRRRGGRPALPPQPPPEPDGLFAALGALRIVGRA